MREVKELAPQILNIEPSRQKAQQLQSSEVEMSSMLEEQHVGQCG